MNELISIIIPIYGVEKYLERCLEAVIGQSYKNLEIILVDDGSPDRAGEICDGYAKRDNRIKVIHQENQGLAMARNSGLDVATGRYISFIDSDDFMSRRMIEYLYKSIKEQDADISICDFLKFEEDASIKEQEKSYIGIQKKNIGSQEERIQYMFLDKYVDSIIVWNKLYKRELWENVRFPKVRAYEDEAVLYKILDHADKIVYVEEKLYYYMQRRSGSITSEGFSEKRLLRLDVLKERMDYYIQNEMWKYFIEMLFVYKTDLLKVMEMIEESDSYPMHMLKDRQRIYKEYCLRYLICHDRRWKNILTHVWFAYLPNCYYRRYKNRK